MWWRPDQTQMMRTSCTSWRRKAAWQTGLTATAPCQTTSTSGGIAGTEVRPGTHSLNTLISSTHLLWVMQNKLLVFQPTVSTLFCDFGSCTGEKFTISSHLISFSAKFFWECEKLCQWMITVLDYHYLPELYLGTCQFISFTSQITLANVSLHLLYQN